MADTQSLVLDWMASDDTGLSSKTIALWLSGRRSLQGWGVCTPSDPADLGRCLRLIARIPEFRARFSEMAEAGGMWPEFVEAWPQIEAAFIEECGGRLLAKGEGRGIKCTRTYELMKATEDKARSRINAERAS